jgi:flagellar basal body P-ring formation protein FlgA
MRTKPIFKSLLLAALFIVSGWSADGAEIELRDNAVVDGAIVRLGDIAQIRHEEGAIAAVWEALPLFPAPASGKARVVRQQELAQLLAFSDETLAHVRIVGSPAVKIQTGPTVVTATDAPAKTVTSGHQGVVPASHQSAAKPNDKPVVHAASRIAVEVAGNTPISTGETFVVVATRKLDKGYRIRREDVEVRQVSGEMAGGIADPAAVIGRETTQAINPATAIHSGMVQLPRLVRRGETVTVRSIASGICITTSGKALDDGSEGSLISIDLDETHERISARVTGVQQVEVYAIGPRLPAKSSATASAK